MPIATNAQGQALRLDPASGQWVPTQLATNPQTKETVALDGDKWVPLGTQTAQPQAPAEQPGLLARVKNAVIAPEGERDKTLGEAVVGGITGIPAAIGHEFMDNARNFKKHLLPSTPQEFEDAQPMGVIPKEALDIAGMVASPITGAITSAIGRPVEQQTGIRRGITGAVLSAAVPLGGEASLANDAAKTEKATAALKPMAAEAHAAGYVLSPRMISDKPGIIADALAGISGKVKTAQAAAEKNQEVTNAISATDLGLPATADLSTPGIFKKVRAEAGKAYESVKTAVPSLRADDEYLGEVKSLGGANSDAALHFPNTMKNQGIADLIDELSSVKDFPTNAGMELVKALRSRAVSNLKAIGDDSKHALGLAQRQAADAMDGLIERNIAAQGGDTGLVKAYKDARQLIAKSYDVEGATNAATGDVNALGLAKLASKGKPLSGGLQTVAKIAQAFPKAMQAGVVSEPVSALDFFGAAALAAHGNPKMAGMMLARPVSRATILSKPVQNALANPAARSSAIPRNVLRRAPAANAFHKLSEKPQN
jgi:hypothetical protein